MHKTYQNKWAISVITIALVLVAASPLAAQAKQQNAADIYRKAIDLHKTDYSLMKIVRQVTWGKTDPNQAVIDYVNANRKVIDLTVQASKIDYCNWGDHFSPHDPDDNTLIDVLYLAELVLADTRIRLDSAAPQKLLQRCVSVYDITSHVGAEGFGFVTGTVLQGKASDTLALVLSNGNIDYKTLQLLKRRLVQQQKTRTPYIETYDSETSYIINKIEKGIKANPDITIDEVVSNPEFALFFGWQLHQIKNVNLKNMELVDIGIDYYIQHSKSIREVLQKPYSQAYPEIIKLEEKALNDSHIKDESTGKSTVHYDAMFASFMNDIKGPYSYSIKSDTHFNATLCALDLYIIKAKTGSLPKKLPPNSPKDLFSNKDFIYKKTTEGFTLTCQGKDVKKNKIHQWQFKIPDK